MNNSSNIHWSKDFVEHVRTVHFTLVLVASVLIIAGTNFQSARTSVALTQIQQIAKLERDWRTVPTKLYERAMLDSKLETAWEEPLAIVLPKDIYKEGEIDVYLNVPEDVIVAPRTWQFGGATLPTELSNLSQFRDFWNMLNEGLTLVLPEPPKIPASCDEMVRLEYTDGSRDLLLDQDESAVEEDEKPKCIAGNGILSAMVGPRFDLKYDLVASGPNIMKDRILDLWVSMRIPVEKLALPRRKDTKAVVATSAIGLNPVFVTIHEDYLTRLFFNDWKRGNFDAAFPELRTVSADISTLEINDAIHRLELLAASSERSVSVLGFTIPLPQLSQWGVLVLLSVQLYLWLHLHELATRIRPDAEGWNVAWIGFYRTRAAIAIIVLSCFLLPVTAALTLAFRIVSLGFYFRRTAQAGAISVVLLSALLGYFTVWRLVRLRGNIRASDELLPLCQQRPVVETGLASLRLPKTKRIPSDRGGKMPDTQAGKADP